MWSDDEMTGDADEGVKCKIGVHSGVRGEGDSLSEDRELFPG